MICLHETDHAAQERLDTLLLKLAVSAGAAEELKARDPMKWDGIMNTCRAQAEETEQLMNPTRIEYNQRIGRNRGKYQLFHSVN